MKYEKPYLSAYVDIDWVKCVTSRRSITSYYLLFNGSIILGKIKKLFLGPPLFLGPALNLNIKLNNVRINVDFKTVFRFRYYRFNLC